MSLLEGIMYSAQYLTIFHREENLSEQLMRDSGFTEADFIKAQALTGFYTRQMNKVIREAFRDKQTNPPQGDAGAE